ncbi:hypothetical protein KKF34_07010 [Myxococcota bacterium]|nr:hypothetical protein [Myxococcota bacterium]MBU1379188.1 hypothetical protein [Myxococcota bacterium]MBU1496611.1 hypothetical protein [Myxococcota bacterium]
MKRLLLLPVIFAAVACASGSTTETNNTNNTGNGGFGDICTKDSDCDSNYCILWVSDFKMHCSEVCSTQNCPAGHSCRPYSRDNAEVSICFPDVSGFQCAECATDTQCGNYSDRCMVFGETNVCLSDCSIGADCPSGYQCQSMTSVAGYSGNFCIPETGGCDCTAASVGLTVACENSNAYGTCTGVKQCLGDAGWSQCNAAEPAEEVCDTVDNNCNGQVDEGFLGTEGHCEQCNTPCPGTGIEGTTTSCDGACVMTCSANYYDADSRDDTGCECKDDTQAGTTVSTAANLGSGDDCDFAITASNLKIPVDEFKIGGTDYFKFNYENNWDPTCWSYPYVSLSVPASGIKLRMCAGTGTTESSWTRCVTVSPGQTQEIDLEAIGPGNGDSETFYLKVLSDPTNTPGPNCSNYSITIGDD